MMNEKKQTYDLEARLIDFAVQIIEIVETLPKTRTGNHIAGQLVRSGTSPASNYGEAQSAESRNDFIHKMKIALKELRETHVWLRIIEKRALIKASKKLVNVLSECNELISIFVASVATSRRNSKHQKRKNN